MGLGGNKEGIGLLERILREAANCASASYLASSHEWLRLLAIILDDETTFRAGKVLLLMRRLLEELTLVAATVRGTARRGVVGLGEGMRVEPSFGAIQIYRLFLRLIAGKGQIVRHVCVRALSLPTFALLPFRHALKSLAGELLLDQIGCLEPSVCI